MVSSFSATKKAYLTTNAISIVALQYLLINQGHWITRHTPMHTSQCTNKEAGVSSPAQGHRVLAGHRSSCRTGVTVLKLKLCSIQVLVRLLFRTVKGHPGISKLEEKGFWEGKTRSGFFYDTLGFRYIDLLSDQDQYTVANSVSGAWTSSSIRG